ncbi:MAG: DEAD/DEAH box helicase, partial [Oscillospiraceae bacterium]|nr:DEAD/DEAH box helicase [Oscillospiraceae bacterium]
MANPSAAAPSGAFARLSPFIREYVYKNRWDELRPIQEEACGVILDTEDHMLLASGTATGKTEAAFLPILTLLERDPPSSVGVLYVAPMKALINDQFGRLSGLMEQSGIPLRHWHGDVSGSRKNAFLKDPGGVLQITPESMEAMLINRVHDLSRIFGDLRFVVIDEMHAFMSADRGLQVLCQLARLRRYMRAEPRRVGLSATLGDYALPAEWLAAGTSRPVTVPDPRVGPQRIRLSVEHFGKPFTEDGDAISHPSMRYMYERTLGRKAIIFGNGRPTPDAAITAMRAFAREEGRPDAYHVHHGAISSTLREAAERDIKESEGQVVIGATVTMELGVDIGRLDRVFQIGPPISVASFVQRLGRTGRRGEPAEMWFVSNESRASDDPCPLMQVPWYLLKIMAIIQLYLEERWIEPPKVLRHSMSLLYHQTMSMAASYGEVSAEALSEGVRSLPAFTGMGAATVDGFIDELIGMGHLQRMDRGGLIVGLEGERVVGSHEFYGVFPSEEEWIVMHGSEKIGQVEEPLAVGEPITVAGYGWVVVGVDHRRLSVCVKPLAGRMRYLWPGDRALTHDRVLQRMRRVLAEGDEYPYLGPTAVERLRRARSLSDSLGLAERNVVGLGDGVIGVLPWMGHRNYNTLKRVLQARMRGVRIGGMRTYFLTLRQEGLSREDALGWARATFEGELDPHEFIKA